MERKEAIEVIKKNWPDSGFTMLREALETLIPELAESEDESIRKDIVAAVETYGDFTQGRKEEIYAWLEKQSEQKPAEWSEEDEVKINRIVACLENLNVADNDILLKDVDWLKSLRPQSTWKPSDKQLIALKEACDEHWEPDGLDPLYTLYQQLKKLREE